MKAATVAIGLIAVAIAIIGCSVPSSTPTPRPTDTPRPTYTPYPAYTPAAAVAPGPIHTSRPTSVAPSEDFTLAVVGQSTERFSGAASDAYDKGKEQLANGEYVAAIASFQEAQRHHGKPAAVVENWIGLAYHALDQYDMAIVHLSNAIAINDNTITRSNRARAYVNNAQCDSAISDAQAALAKAPVAVAGISTDAEANSVLAMCYYDKAQYLKALQHIDASIAIANDYQYAKSEVALMTELREAIRYELNPEVGSIKEWFFSAARIAYDKGQEQFANGEYEAAIASFKEAQRHHSKPSAVLENYIGLTYRALGQYDTSIVHHSNAIAINDAAVYLSNRAISYSNNSQYELAIIDARDALSKNPNTGEGINTDVDANWILAVCYYEQSKYLQALQHADVAIAIANDHQYAESEVVLMTELRDAIRYELNR